jgi:transcriptional regulator EpsA
VNAAQAPEPSSARPYADSLLLTPRDAESLLRIVETSLQVRRRYQFYFWAQSQLHELLPHRALVCGAWHREAGELRFEAFHGIVLPAGVLQTLTDAQRPLLRAVIAAWIAQQGRALALDLEGLGGVDDAAALLRDAGIERLLVHGVARPQRPDELESCFVFADRGATEAGALAAVHLELVLPYLHSTWMRVVAAEHGVSPRGRTAPRMPPEPTRPAPAAEAPTPARRAVGRTRPQRPDAPGAGGPVATPGITERERQILQWVCEGKSNAQIAEVLGISALTVKNHMQKILRKLRASNRAHAVAQALALGILGGGEQAPRRDEG